MRVYRIHDRKETEGMRTNSIAFAGTIYSARRDESIDLNYSPTGNAWITFKVATYGGKTRDGDKADKVYHKCLAFGETAEQIAETLEPGDQVMVFGHIESDNYTNKEGVKVYQTKVMVNEIGATLRYQTVDVTPFDRSVQVLTSQPADAGDGGQVKIPTDEAPF
jgi:single-strand DNA-binding protein